MPHRASSDEGIAVLGGGNLGQALVRGWIKAGRYLPRDITVSRRQTQRLSDLASAGCVITGDSASAVHQRRTVVVAVQPQQIEELFEQIRGSLSSDHRVISVASGVSIASLRTLGAADCSIVRAMPNTAVSIGESMTCLAADSDAEAALREAVDLFDLVGRTLVIPEEMMVPATALCACGIAFFLRSVRAATQGGIEIGFHPEDAQLLAAQTAKGSAGLLLAEGDHPESQIDKVTTPRGCTIAGLNEMEHQGFSSALIKGILVSAEKAARLYGS
jgi:pyrroline-5-carboxylate reductase